jgi:hypothetical protein
LLFGPTSAIVAVCVGSVNVVTVFATDTVSPFVEGATVGPTGGPTTGPSSSPLGGGGGGGGTGVAIPNTALYV